MRTPPRAAPALPERASWQSASSSWRPWIDPLGLGPSKARIREQPTRRARRARRDERRGCGHGVTIPSGARPGKNGSYPESNGPEVAPGPARLAPARYSLEAEADAGRNDIGVPGVARARRVRDRIERAAREHVATCTVPGDPGGEPPGNPNERLGADVRPRTSRLAIEDRSEAGAGRRRGEPLDRLGSPLHHQAAVHAEGWRQGIGGPGADLGAAVLVVADGHARVRDVQAGLEQGVVVVNAQRGELRAKVGPIARVRVQRLEVTDRAEGRVPGLVTRGVQGHRFEEQRAELVAGPDVEQPRVDIGGGLAAGNDAGVGKGGRESVRHNGSVPELVEDGRVEGEWARTEPRVDAHRMAVLVDALSPGAIRVGECGAGIDAAAALAGTAAGRAAGGEVGVHRLDVEALHRGDLRSEDGGPVIPAKLGRVDPARRNGARTIRR